MVEDRFKNLLLNIIINHLPDARIYLFGSRARDKNRSGSDIDIGIDLGEEINNEIEKDIYRDAIIKRLQWFFIIFILYLEKYLRFVIALPHQEVKNMIRELLRVGKITQKEAEFFLKLLEDYYVLSNNEYDVIFSENVAGDICRGISLLYTVMDKIKPKLDEKMGFLI